MIDKLVRHMARLYSDWHIKHDLDCVLDAPPDDLTRDAVRQYARLRRKAPGFNPTSYRPERARNSHSGLQQADIDALVASATPKSGRACCLCHERLEAKRSDARFCSPAHRQAARRMHGVVVGRVVSGSDTCPHRSTLAQCPDVWCKSRLEDLAEHSDYPVLMAPEPVTDNAVLMAA